VDWLLPANSRQSIPTIYGEATVSFNSSLGLTFCTHRYPDALLNATRSTAKTAELINTHPRVTREDISGTVVQSLGITDVSASEINDLYRNRNNGAHLDRILADMVCFEAFVRFSSCLKADTATKDLAESASRMEHTWSLGHRCKSLCDRISVEGVARQPREYRSKCYSKKTFLWVSTHEPVRRLGGLSPTAWISTSYK
jgi:hypothetical protein